MENLENAKVGDWVFVWGMHSKTLRRIDKITPKGFIRVGGSLYTKEGHERGGDIWSRKCISLAKPEEVEMFKKQVFVRKVIEKLSKLTSKDIDYETAVTLNNLLNLDVEDVE